jgi:5-methylcytosine-specific restriction enzyme A
MPERPKQYRPPQPARSHTVPAATRLSAHKREYGSRWQKFRVVFLREHALCECGPDCCPDGCHEPATEIDHIRPVQGPDDPGFFDESNLQALTEACHGRKTAKDRREGTCRH